MLRSCAFRLLALSLGLFAGILIAEVGIRFWPGAVPPAVRAAVGQHDLRLVATRDSELGYKLEPGIEDVPLPTHDFSVFHLTTRSVDGSDAGFRTAEHDEPPFAVVVGDSFAMGWGVEQGDSFAAHIERMTERSFLNLGIVGYGPQQSAQTLIRHGLSAAPRLVLWVLYGNDFVDAHTFEGWVESGRPEWWLTSKSDFEIWFAQNSSTYKLYKALAPYRSPSRFHWDGGGAEYVFVRQPAVELDLTRAEVRTGLDTLKRIWQDLAPRAEAVGSKVAVVSVPYKEAVHRDALAAWEGVPQVGEEHWIAASNEALEHARSLGFHTLDLLPTLERQRGGQLYFPIDPHLTPLGNRVVGERVAEWLEGEGLLGGEAPPTPAAEIPPLTR